MRRKMGWLLVVVGGLLTLGDLAGAARWHPIVYDYCHLGFPGTHDSGRRVGDTPIWVSSNGSNYFACTYGGGHSPSPFVTGWLPRDPAAPPSDPGPPATPAPVISPPMLSYS